MRWDEARRQGATIGRQRGGELMSQQITIKVSDEVVRHATKIATQTLRPIEEVLAAWLESVVNELPVEQLPDNDVLALTELQLAAQQQDVLSELLALNREGTI